ncbi:something about silencing, SAS, complex subunit 4-domain-containing protein [Aspergillus desertorum]
MRKAFGITAAAISGLTLAVSLYLLHQKRYLASQVSHFSKRGQLASSTPRNISSIPPDIFSSKYYTLYDYVSISMPRHTLPDLEPSQLLIILLRRNMSSFASSPQARLLKLAASGSETVRSFDRTYIAALDFNEGDLVCNAYRVRLCTQEKVEFEFLFGAQGRLVVSVEVRGEDVVFHNETIMWREQDAEQKLPLERGLANWPSLRGFPTDSMTTTAIMPARSRSSFRVLHRDPDATGEDSTGEESAGVQPHPLKRPLLNPLSSRRRKSSPDLLDTTIDSSPSTTTTNTATSSSTKLRRPRPLFAHSAHITSSPPPGSSTPRARNLRLHHPSNRNSAAFYLNGGRESPDPLDTISPAPAPAPKSITSTPTSTLKTKPPTTTTSTPTPTSAAYRQRRLTHYLKPEPAVQAVKESPKSKDALPSRGPTLPSSSDGSTAQLFAVPAPTADRAVPEKRRCLRSHDGGSRARSELALYFPNYDQIMSLEPPKTGLISGRTVIKLIDDLLEPPIPSCAFSSSDPDTLFGNPLVNLHKCDVIALPDSRPKNDPGPDTEAGEKGEEEDPLNEEFYFKAHRRHERQEKQLRNIERDRAQHDQQQLDRLLHELQSHDWLRVMGITGRSLSEQEKKLYEPKRDYFITEISALLQKFKIWKEEEKRRKLDKDYKPASFHSDAANEPSHVFAKDYERKDEDEDAIAESPRDDVDALAARQLLQEAHSATAGRRPKPETGQQDLLQPALPPLPDPLKPFTSFFAKPYLRAQAMSGNRKGRTRLAFGHPIPEVAEREFELPRDILTPETIKDCQRKRRRMKRERASLGRSPTLTTL